MLIIETTYKPYIQIKEDKLYAMWENHYKQEFSFNDWISHLIETKEYRIVDR